MTRPEWFPPAHVVWFSIAAMVGVWFVFVLADRDPPYEYLGTESGSQIIPDPAVAGSVVSTDWKLTRVERDCPRTVERIFTERETGKFITLLDATPLSTTVRTSATSLSRSFTLPAALPAKTNYHVITRFQCNFTHAWFPVTVVSPKLPINIVGK